MMGENPINYERLAAEIIRLQANNPKDDVREIASKAQDDAPIDYEKLAAEIIRQQANNTKDCTSCVTT
jgi:hypothetical protein